MVCTELRRYIFFFGAVSKILALEYMVHYISVAIYHIFYVIVHSIHPMIYVK